MKKQTILSCLAFSVMLFPAAVYAQGPLEKAQGLFIDGDGQAKAMPDSFSTNISIQQSAPTTKEVTTLLSQRTSQLVNVLKALSLKNMTLETQNFSIEPVYEHDRSWNEHLTPDHYQGNASMTVTVKGLTVEQISSQLAMLSDMAIQNGADHVGETRYFIDHLKAVDEAALKNAIQNAMETAKVTADFAQIHLGPLDFIQVHSAPLEAGPVMASPMAFTMAKAARAPMVAPDNFQLTPIQINEHVMLRYQILP